MGLSNIFDPIVRLYFDSLSPGSSDGVPNTGVMCAVFDPGKKADYETFLPDGSDPEGTMYKIAEVIPTVNDLSGAIIVVKDFSYGSSFSPHGGFDVFSQEEAPGLAVCAPITTDGGSISGVTFVSLTADAMSEFFAHNSSGLWFMGTVEAVTYLIWKQK